MTIKEIPQYGVILREIEYEKKVEEITKNIKNHLQCGYEENLEFLILSGVREILNDMYIKCMKERN